MTKEKLMEWGLTEEQATKVMEGLNGFFVTKARFDKVNTELANFRFYRSSFPTDAVERSTVSGDFMDAHRDNRFFEKVFCGLDGFAVHIHAEHRQKQRLLGIQKIQIAAHGAVAL